MRKKLIQSLTLLLMVVGVGTFVSCNDINEDLYNEYQYETENRLEQLEQEIEKLEQEIETAQKGCDENCPHYSSEDIINIINEYIDEIKRTGKEPEGGLGSIISDLSTLQGRQDAADKLLDDTIEELKALREQVANLKNCECSPVDLAELEAKILEAQTTAKEALDLAQANSAAISAMESRITSVEGDAANALEQAAKANALAEKDSVLISELTKAFEATVEEVNGIIQELQDETGKNTENIGNLNKALEALKKTVDEHTEKLKKLDEIEKEIEKIKSECAANLAAAKEYAETLVEELKEQLEERLNNVEERLDAIEEDIKDIIPDLKAIQDFLKKQVTSIIIQGTYNPAFGTLDLPFDVQSNILVAYYGKPMKDVEFPTNRTSNYVRAKEALTEGDMQMLGIESESFPANVPLMFENGYAGKVYMTINPNTANLDGLKLDIVNTQDEVSPIQLSPITASSEKLQFGYTRADNGFYEANATVAPGDVEKIQHLSVNKDAIKDAFNEIVNNRLDASIEQVASDVYKVVKGLKLDKSGLRSSYTTNEGTEYEQTHSVYSQYNLAATAIEPLSFASYKDLNYQTIPGYERVNNLLDIVSKQTKEKVHFLFKGINDAAIVDLIKNLEIKNIEIPEISDDLLAKFVVKMDTTIVIGDLTYKFNPPTEGQIVPVKFTKDAYGELEVDKALFIDLKKDVVEETTIAVTTKGKTNTGAAMLVVPVTDDNGNIVGNATIELEESQVKVSIENGKIMLNTQEVAVLEANTIITSGDANGTYAIEDSDLGDSGTYTKSITIVFEYDLKDAAEELWGLAADALGNINDDLLKQIRDIVKELNNVLDKINNYEGVVNNTIDGYLDKVRDYLDKINNKTVGFVNSINNRFQPFMVVSDAKGIKRLSGSKNYPTVVKSNVTLYPTTQTMELLVPVARKHVAVTNVFKGNESAQGGNGDCKARLEAANSGQLNTVLDGNVRQINLQGLKSGYVYEIAYSGLDFHGNIATRKYYVTVK